MRQSEASRRGINTQVARSRLRLDRLRHLSAEGVDIKDAAETVGLTVDGVRILLQKHEGSRSWPIA